MSKRSKLADQAIQKARILHKQGQHARAQDIYRLILLEHPDNTTAMLDLGNSLAVSGETAEPRTLYTRVLELDPHDGYAKVALTIATMEGDDMEEAVRLAAEARKMKLSAQSLSLLGVFYRKAGMKEEAIDCLTAAIKLAPADVAPYFSLYRLQKITPKDPEFRNLLAIEKKADTLHTNERAALHFVLADTYLAADNTDEAFRHYAEGNRIKKEKAFFNAALFTKQIDTLIAQFTPELVKSLKGNGNGSERPVFIVGMPRSGSTLVAQIIASHPQAKAIGESRAMKDSVPENFQRAPETINLTPQALKDIAAKYLQATDRHAKGALRLADKMLGNFIWIGLIRLALPNAKIIHCTRDPVDIAFSMWQILFSEGLVPWAYDPADIGAYFKAYRKLMAHWEKLFPGDIYEANYEALIANQEPESKKLIAACGLPWDEHCLKFHETHRFVKTASADQVRRPIYAESAKKWKKYEKYLGPLIEAVKE